MQKIKIVVLLTALFIPAFLSAAPASDKIAAKVNDGLVLESEVNEAFEAMKAQLEAAGQKVSPDQLKKEILENLVQQKLLITIAQEEMVMVSEEAVADKVNEFLSGLRSRFANEEAFEEALNKEGLSYTDFRLKIESQVRDGLVFTKLKQKKQQDFISKAPVAEAEMSEYYQEHKGEFKVGDEVNISQVMIMPGYSGNSSQKAAEVASRLKSGEDFEKVASSLDGVSGISAAELGWIDTTQLAKPIMDALAKPSKNKVVNVKSDGSYHVIKILDYKSGSEQTLDDVKDKVRMKLIEGKVDKMWQDWIDEVKAKAYIKYM
ncbi:MAG: SurA N-terminal domain-containing protein [Candidatus Goldbacteria bacterium]|nr:SurA N-terminal domain-containing protein [Candidatus Goldiibacteriota bacterium]